MRKAIHWILSILAVIWFMATMTVLVVYDLCWKAILLGGVIIAIWGFHTMVFREKEESDDK
jgi:hypothetical protein